MAQQLRAMEMQFQQQQRPGQPPVIITQPAVARAELEANVTIVPDEVTNSLLVRATPADWQIVQQALQALDLRPLQVVIEVVIAEVRRNNELNVGVSFSGTDARPREGEMTAGGITRTPGADDFSLRIIRTGDIDIDATLSALARSGNVRILSRPVVHAQNNQEAHISVGEQRPFIQVSRQLPTDQPVRDDVVSYIDVATALTILPTINADGYVNLAVTQEVNSATEVVQFGAPVISTREATTQILARNGQTVVIGGLVDRQRDRSRSGIPLLKDIPVLGFLFGSTRDNTINSELFLFLTPYIVASDEDADRVREEIERKAEQIKPLVPIVPILPPVIRPDTIRGPVR
jgi:general secretion pathway protein D